MPRDAAGKGWEGKVEDKGLFVKIGHFLLLEHMRSGSSCTKFEDVDFGEGRLGRGHRPLPGRLVTLNVHLHPRFTNDTHPEKTQQH